MQWLYILLYTYNGFYEKYLYNVFLRGLFPLKLLLAWIGCFKICKYAFWNIWKIVSGILNIWKGYEQKIVPDTLRFASMLFKIFEKGVWPKNCPRYFEICKYAFLKIWNKCMSKKIVPGILRFGSMLF